MDEFELEYVVKDALMMCDKGAAPNKFTPTYNTSNYIEGLLVATNMDGKPGENIPSFYMCEVTQTVCIPDTAPMTWTEPCPDKVDGIEALLARCTCPCKTGGTIEFYTSGQIPLPQEQEDALKEMQDEAQGELNDAGYGDTVGEASFWESFIPFWGSGRDAVNSFQQGKWGWGLFNCGMVVVDGLTLGIGSVVKGALKNGGKVAVKTVAKNAFKNLGCKVLTKSSHLLNKALLKTVLKEQALKRLANPKTWCFAGDTLIHTGTGTKEIRDIEIGDIVKSYLPEEGKVVYRKVTALFENKVDTTLEIITNTGSIRCTPNHPFYLGDGNYRDASQFQVGDELFTNDGESVFVKSSQLIDETIKVYNFEVEDSHCYFVGEAGVLVHNSCAEALKKILPSWKKITMNLDHIVSNHTLNGAGYIARMKSGTLRNIGKFPDYMSKEQVGKMVLEAYKNPVKKVKTVIQDGVEKIVIQGKAKDGTIIEMWLDKAGKHLETAYPK